METLCRKYTAINNAKSRYIYKRASYSPSPLTKEEYLDLLYEILKNVPRDILGLRKHEYDYRLLRSDLYKIAKVKEPTRNELNKIAFAKPHAVSVRDRQNVIEFLQVYRDLLNLKSKNFTTWIVPS